MLAVRAVDGVSYSIDIDSINRDRPAGSSEYDSLRAQLVELSSIPTSDLISLHPNGRQCDEATARVIMNSTDSNNQDLEPVFLFDRQLIELDPDGTDIQEYLQEGDWVLERVLNDVHDDRESIRGPIISLTTA